ncbi:hypothetical protein C8Q79DRAFT_73527 [Trametes meyenii]|nr:hypothetical protein C8Q79DRAFT_73527 [Trametes meyenii]
MLLRRAIVEGRRSALIAAPAHAVRLFHARPRRPPPARPPRDRSSSSADPASQSKSDDPRLARLQDAINVFHGSVTSGSAHSPRAAYNTLVSCLTTFHGQCKVLRIPPSIRFQLQGALVRLAGSRYDEDFDLLGDAVRRSARLFGVQVDAYAKDIFSRLLVDHRTRSAFHWLEMSTKMPDLHYALKVDTWRDLLEVVAELRDESLLERILRKMEKLHMYGRQETSALIFSALFRSPPSSPRRPPPFEAVKHLINIFPPCRIPYDEVSLQTIVDGYTRAGREDLAKDAEYIYVSVQGGSGSVSHEQFNKILADLARRKPRDAVVRAYNRFAQIGLQASITTLEAVLGESTNLSDLKYWEQLTQQKPNSRILSLIMDRRATRNSSVLEVYEFARTRGITLTATMLEHMVRPLLTSRGLERPTERAIDKALGLYEEHIGRISPSPTEPATNDEDMRPTAATYRLLLRALTASINVPKYLPIAVALVADMQRFERRLDSPTAASVLVLLMTSSPTPQDAFRMYGLVARSMEQSSNPVLDEGGYVAVLDVFCRHPGWPNGVPSTQLYFEILADMRKHGIPLGPKAYTVLIAQMAKLATAAATGDDMATREAIAKTIERVHNHLTVNPSFTPDTALWNQLMDAYQRAGCFAEAVRIWQSLFASATFNAASVSIILDACAFARAYDMAVRVYSLLNEVGFPMSTKNWNTYLECLCRLGRLDEAMKVLCLEMTGRDDGIEPDKESLRIVLKFAIKNNQEGEVRSRLKRFLPKLYHAVLSDLS